MIHSFDVHERTRFPLNVGVCVLKIEVKEKWKSEEKEAKIERKPIFLYGNNVANTQEQQ